MASATSGAALGWNGEVSHVPHLVYRHSVTIMHLVAFPEIALLIGVDSSGVAFGLSTNQINESTKHFICHPNIFQVPDGSLISDVQRVMIPDGSFVIAFAMVDLDANLAKTEKLVFCRLCSFTDFYIT